MRRLLTILLLVAFGLPFVQPLFALSANNDANLPACCRRNGKHHCMMSMAERRVLLRHALQYRAPEERCPFCPHEIAVAPQLPLFTALTPQYAAVPIANHPAGIAQTQSKWRIARDRSRQKRGPPAVFFL